MSKTRTALQADENLLHESSFCLSYCLTVLVHQSVRLVALERHYQDDRDARGSSRAGYVQHSMLMPQMWSGLPRYVPLIAHDRRR
jgi:hypothetical protein